MMVCGDVEITCALSSYRPVVNRELCVKCGTCAYFCKKECIFKSDDGFFHSKNACCKGCGVCAKVCPQHAIEIEEVGAVFMLS